MDKYVVVDVDNTIADINERLEYANRYAKYLTPSWWDVFLDGRNFWMDKPILPAKFFLKKIENMFADVGIIYMSGRRDNDIQYFREWLRNNNFPLMRKEETGYIPHLIFFRPKGVETEKFKSDRLEHLSKLYELIGGISDSDSDIEVYKKVGIDIVRKVNTKYVVDKKTGKKYIPYELVIDDWKEFFDELVCKL